MCRKESMVLILVMVLLMPFVAHAAPISPPSPPIICPVGVDSCSNTNGLGDVAEISVIPGLVGFGTSTPAGRGGRVYRITNLNASGSGSFANCALASGPRVCIFEVSGYINLKDDLIIKNPFLTIAGQTAPSPGITIRNGGIRIATHDVLLQHIRVRPGDQTTGNHNGDAITIAGESHGSKNTSNIVIDHISASWGWDEVVSTVSRYVHDITISSSIISEGIHVPSDSNKPAMGLLVGGRTENILITRNLLAHHNHRNPYLQGYSTSAVINNLIYNPAARGLQLEDGYNWGEVKSTVIGNVMMHGPSTMQNAAILQVKRDVTSAKIFWSDNVTLSKTGSRIDNLIWNDAKINYQVFQPTVDLSRIKVASSNEVAGVILSNSGARPLDRDAVDVRIVGDVMNGTGKRINCVTDDGSATCDLNAGGWPALASNSRKLVLPENPHGDDDYDGYTNLEEWLHEFSDELEP